MKKENLSAALNDIDFDMVEDAYDSAHSNSQKKNKHFRLPRWGAIAACLCLIIAVGALVIPTFENAFRNEVVGEERLALVGSTLEYDNGTIVYHTDNYADRTLAFTLEKEDDSPICLAFRGTRTVEDNEDHCEIISPYSGYEPITRNATVVDNLLTFSVNGIEADSLPTEAGTYEIVIDYSKLDDFLDAGYQSVWLIGFEGLKSGDADVDGLLINSQSLPEITSGSGEPVVGGADMPNAENNNASEMEQTQPAADETNNIPTLAEVSQMKVEEVDEVLVGKTVNELREAWGEPIDSDEYGETWQVDSLMIIVVEYDKNTDSGIIESCELISGTPLAPSEG